MKRILVVGGANGIGLSMAVELASRPDTEKVYIVDKAPLSEVYRHEKIESMVFDLTVEDYSLFDRYSDINSLIVTAGFGRLALFRDVTDEYIRQSFVVNTLPVLRIIKRFYPKLESQQDFYCGVMVSIAGFMSSPFFAVYGATKAALKVFIESVNVELEKAGTTNRILNISPGSIKGTSFNAGTTELSQTQELSKEIIAHIEAKDDLFIPQYDEVFREVLERYHTDFRAEGRHSYEYKVASGRVKVTPPNTPQPVATRNR
ncbi:MAG: SDR family oxidoreductase [Bacteroidales bacterium]|nr:SDR family oxidoreductase [Bacteroidales bacterium]